MNIDLRAGEAKKASPARFFSFFTTEMQNSPTEPHRVFDSAAHKSLTVQRKFEKNEKRSCIFKETTLKW